MFQYFVDPLWLIHLPNQKPYKVPTTEQTKALFKPTVQTRKKKLSLVSDTRGEGSSHVSHGVINSLRILCEDRRELWAIEPLFVRGLTEALWDKHCYGFTHCGLYRTWFVAQLCNGRELEMAPNHMWHGILLAGMLFRTALNPTHTLPMQKW